MFFEALGTEVVLNLVLESIDDWHDLHALSHTCKFMWHTVSRDARLWRSVFLRSVPHRAFLYHHPQLAGPARHALALDEAPAADGPVFDKVTCAAEEFESLRWDWRHVCLHSSPLPLPPPPHGGGGSDGSNGGANNENISTINFRSNDGAVVLLLPQPTPHMAIGHRLIPGAVVVGVNSGSSLDPFAPAWVKQPAPADIVRVGPLTVSMPLDILGSRCVTVIAGVEVRSNETPLSIVTGHTAFFGCTFASCARAALHSPLPLSTIVLSSCHIETYPKPVQEPETAPVSTCISAAGSRVLCRKSSFVSRTGAALVFSANAAVGLVECNITSEGGFGVFGYGVQLRMTGCDVHETKLSGIVVRDGAKLAATGCVFRAARQCGVLVANSSTFKLTECRLSDSVMRGLQMEGECSGELSKCIVESNKEIGVAIQGGTATIAECILRNNGGSGAAVYEGKLDVTRCLLTGNRIYGVHFAEGTHGMVTECDILGNAGGAVGTKTGAVVITKNRMVRNAGGIQLRIKDKSTPQISANEMKDNEIQDPAIERAISDGVCTIFVTGERFTAQYWFYC
jgi:hypothetical protein